MWTFQTWFLRLQWRVAAGLFVLLWLPWYGCLCSQLITIPGLDAGQQTDGGTKITESDPTEALTEAPAPRENLPESGPEPSVEPQPPETVLDTATSDTTATACPNPNDIACFHCHLALDKSEAILLNHRRYVLTTKDYVHRWFDLQTCQSQPWNWVGKSLLQVIAIDPDSAQVLLAATQVDGNVTQITLGLFDLSRPMQPLRVLSFPKNTYLEPRYNKPPYDRRGLVNVQEKDSTGKLLVMRVAHFQMSGSHLVEMTLPPDHSVFTYTLHPHLYMEEHEVFVLLYRPAGATRNRYPLLIWSVRDQRIVRIVDRGERVMPQQMFASTQDVFVLEADPADRTRYDLIRYPIAGGNEQKVAIPGCSALWGDNQLGVLACLHQDKMYRFALPTFTAITTVSLPAQMQPVTYYPGFWYLRPIQNATYWLRVHFADAGAIYDKITLPGEIPYIALGQYPVQRSTATLPGAAYRVLQSAQNHQQTLGVMDAAKGTIEWLPDKFPVPAIMGRMTEGWEGYDALFTYYVEPQSATTKPSLYYIRIAGRLEVVHTHSPDIIYEAAMNNELTLPSPTRVVVKTHQHISAEDPNKREYELFLLHCKTWKKQQVPLSQSHTIYVSDPYIVLDPNELRSEARNVDVWIMP